MAELRLYSLPREQLDHFRKRLNESRSAPKKDLSFYNSYLGSYSDLLAEISIVIKGKEDSSISENILRKLYHDTGELEVANFNVAYLNAFALFCSNGELSYQEYLQVYIAGHNADEDLEKPDTEGDTVCLDYFPLNLYKAVIPSAIISFFIAQTFQSFSGFGNYEFSLFNKLSPAIFGFCIFLLLMSALLCNIWIILDKRRIGRVTRSFFIVFAFIFLYYSRSMFSRDSFVVQGSTSKAFIGTPDFESIGVALAMIMSAYMMKSKLSSKQKLNWYNALQIGFIGSLSFFAVYLLFRLLLGFEVIVKDEYWISEFLLTFDFPHPERIGLVFIMIFLFVLFYVVFAGRKKGITE